MKAINKINHYAIPQSCSGSSGGCCPLADVDLSGLMPKAWETRFAEIQPDAADLLRDDETGLYTPQGACTDGQYLYRALVYEDELPTKLQKLRMDTGELVQESTVRSYGHANDMTYAEGFLYIAHSSSTNIIYKVSTSDLSYVETITIGPKIWGIAYDPVNKLFVLGNVGAAYLSVYYPDFSFMYRIKPENAFSGMVRQGITADENYIYVALDNAYGAVNGNEQGSRIMVYTWNGMYIKSIHIPIAEIEWGFPYGGRMFYGTYEGRDENNIKHGKIYASPYDLYPEQTVITGRPTDVSGGTDNMQRLPEGTPVRLWEGSASSGEIKLDSAAHGVRLNEDGPFRYLRFRFAGANQQVFDWYPKNEGVAALREVDITAAVENSTIRIREARVLFDHTSQTFVIETSFSETISHDASEGKITITKNTDPASGDLIKIEQIWGVV